MLPAVEAQSLNHTMGREVPNAELHEVYTVFSYNLKIVLYFKLFTLFTHRLFLSFPLL